MLGKNFVICRFLDEGYPDMIAVTFFDDYCLCPFLLQLAC